MSLAACGRIGIELTPLDEGLQETDAGDARDGSLEDDGGEDMDGGVDGDEGGLTDDDAGPIVPVCPTRCENVNGSATCESGTCVVTCATGFADCDGDATNGCEADIADETLSCGGCMLTCENPNGSAVCSGGLCAPTCGAGFGDCDDEPMNGCETNLATVSDCGTCGASCSNEHGTTSCAAGTCLPLCVTGYSDCDGDPANGCETNITSDPARCGSCGNACGTNGQICVDGACAASPCAAGRAECDGDLAVTCETNTTSTLAHCGFCDNACTAANGTPQCMNSACRIASCNSGFANCDGNVSNGCEVRLATTTLHCGACNSRCTNLNGSTSCVGSACVPSCSTGFGDCDTTRQNGCETALNTVNNCGACGNVCPANGGTPVCNAGVCGTVCSMTGTFALKITHQTSWPSNSNIRSGSGQHVYWIRMTGTQNGNTVAETMTDCGRVVPDFTASAVNETFKFEIPNTVFDSGFLPNTTSTLTLSSSAPGASLTLPSSAFLLGASMADPINGAWPSAASGLTRVDMDGDGKAGVTLLYRSGGGYTQPRTSGSLFGSSRAERPYSATRLVFSLNGTLNSCTQSSGTATVSQINTRIFGCKIAGSSGDCDGSEANFLDQNCLVYASGTATYSMVKVANGATCAAVRAAIP